MKMQKTLASDLQRFSDPYRAHGEGREKRKEVGKWVTARKGTE
jgi:hypothetical protein